MRCSTSCRSREAGSRCTRVTRLGATRRAPHHNTYTAEQVIVAAHAYGSAKLLHHMQHKGRLTGLSSELGKRARTNSEQLLYITRTHEEWERDRRGSTSCRGRSRSPRHLAGSGDEHRADLLGAWKQRVRVPRDLPPARRAEAFVRVLAQRDPQAPERGDPAADPRHWSERSFVALCSQTTDTSIELYWHDGLLHSKPSGTPPSVHVPAIEDFVDRVATSWEPTRRRSRPRSSTATPPPISSAGSDRREHETGAVDPYLRMFGQPGLHVMDGSVMPANPG